MTEATRQRETETIKYTEADYNLRQEGVLMLTD